jgi:hypothetical protein
MFGATALLDHPFMKFERGEGGILHLPCGTIPTALEENEVGMVTILISSPGGEPLRWRVAHTAEEVQQIFRDGVMRLNREAEGPEVIPFNP